MLSLKSVAYASSDLKRLTDKNNPMNPVNRTHAILKKFLNSHSNFIAVLSLVIQSFFRLYPVFGLLFLHMIMQSAIIRAFYDDEVEK